MKVLNKNGYVTREVFNALEKALIAAPPALFTDGIINAISDLIRYNTVQSVARAGTGHLGASLSIVELLTCIYYLRFKFRPEDKDDVNRDIFILSKGHAVPALYATLASKGYMNISQLDKLRRLGGLQGHCDISAAGIEANTGSLAMGISRAVGYALAKKRFGSGGNVIVIAGDGELQEGQVWEALLSAASFELNNLYVIIDHNSVQTDQFVRDIVKYNDLCRTMTAMGFAAVQMKVSGATDANAGFDALDALDKKKNKPKVLIAETVKGKGISFMEHTSCLLRPGDRYMWHNKAPDRDEMEGVYFQVRKRVFNTLRQLGVEDVEFPDVDFPAKTAEKAPEGKPVMPAFADALLKAGKNDRVVVFDADLEADCGLTPFRSAYPERFFEMGIMEQHMVSGAAAFARLGYIPVMNSYTAFLTSRANEQIYNYASEGGRGLIAGHMSGVIPATPGKSHQAYRDIACIKNIPSVLIYQPATPLDCERFMDRFFAGGFADESGSGDERGGRAADESGGGGGSGADGGLVYLRMSMAPPAVELPDAPGDLPAGEPFVMKEGKDAVIAGIGPVVLGECMAAALELEKEGINACVINHPWLNRFNRSGLELIFGNGVPVLIVEDHYIDGGFGEGLLAAAAKAGVTNHPPPAGVTNHPLPAGGTLFTKEGKEGEECEEGEEGKEGKESEEKIAHIAIEGFTTTGFRTEALQHFGLDSGSIAKRIRELVECK